MSPKSRKIRTKQIIIRMTPREHAAAHALADREDRTVAALVRWMIERRAVELDTDKGASPKTVAA